MRETIEPVPSRDALPLRDAASKDSNADTILREHMMLAMVGGFVPIPFVDLVASTSVQLDMLKKLALNYNVDFDARSSRAFVTSLTSALGVTTAARFGASAAKLLPGVGTIAGGVTQAVLTGGTTYAVGRVFQGIFREGRDIDALSLAAIRDELENHFRSGMQLARDLAREGPRRLSRRRKGDR
ncbi:MAG: DUF697 domain-containing protein [Myxococcota bacterium]